MARDAGDTLRTARSITVDSTFRSIARESIGGSDRNDYFKFRLRGRSSVDLKLSGLRANANVEVLNRSGNRVPGGLSRRTGRRNEDINLNLNTGTYYVRIFPGSARDRTSYTLRMSANRDRAGETRDTARAITLSSTNRNYLDYVGPSDPNDFYSFTLGSRQTVDLSLTGLTGNANMRLLNASGSTIALSGNGGKTPESISEELAAGEYFIRVFPKGSAKAQYRLGASAAVIPDGGGNSLGTATPIDVDFTTRTYSDRVSDSDTDDYYSFTLASSGQFNLLLDGLTADADVSLLNSLGVEIETSLNTGTANETITRNLAAGSYVIRVYQPLSGNNTPYNLRVSSLPEDNAGQLGSVTKLPRDITADLSGTSFNNPVSYDDFVGGDDTIDDYKFVLSSRSQVAIDLKNLTGNATLQLIRDINNNGLVDPGEIIDVSARSGTSAETLGGTLSAGTYYARVIPASAAATAFYDIEISAFSTGTIPSITRDIRFGSAPGLVTGSRSWITNVGGQVFFVANDGPVSEGGRGQALWRSDGTLDTTVFVKAFTNDISNLVNVNGTLYFTADDGTGKGVELWKSNGTAGGTTLVQDIFVGSESSSPFNLTAVGDTLYFAANDGVNGIELWRSFFNSGTGQQVTELVRDIWVGNSSGPSNLTNVNGTLYFSANDGINGNELWRINSSGQAELAADISVPVNPGDSSSSSPSRFTLVGSTLYFTATTNDDGLEIWKVDNPTAASITPVRVTNIGPGFESSSAANLTNVNGTLFFTANDGLGSELWKLNGNTPEKVTDLAGPGSLNPENLTNVNGTLFFTANNGTNGRELWKSDGTTVGTVLLKDIFDGTGSSNPDNLIAVNGVLYFTATDGINGVELWRSDGTPGGTELTFDIFTGESGSSPSELVNANNRLFFKANSDINGTELWVL